MQYQAKTIVLIVHAIIQIFTTFIMNCKFFDAAV